MTVSFRAPPSRNGEGVPVDVHRVEHHRHVREPQPDPLSLADRQWTGVGERLAVEGPPVRRHRSAQQQVVPPVHGPIGQPHLLMTGQVGAEQNPADSSGGCTSGAGARPVPVRTTASPCPLFPSAEATSGNVPSPNVSVTSNRSPIPMRSASVTAGHDGEAVAVGDGHPVPTHGDPERGVGTGVDEPDPDPLSRPAAQDDRRGRGAPVDQKVRVGDVTGTTQQRRLHAAHPAHPHHPVPHATHRPVAQSPVPEPPPDFRSRARTWSGVRPVPSTQSSRTTTHSAS